MDLPRLSRHIIFLRSGRSVWHAWRGMWIARIVERAFSWGLGVEVKWARVCCQRGFFSIGGADVRADCTPVSVCIDPLYHTVCCPDSEYLSSEYRAIVSHVLCMSNMGTVDRSCDGALARSACVYPEIQLGPAPRRADPLPIPL